MCSIVNVIVITSFLTCTEAIINNTDFNCTTGDNIYDKEILYNNIGGPYHLALDYNTNILFFSYTVKGTDYTFLRKPFMKTFELAYLNVESKEFGFVDGIRGGFTTAIDREGENIYMGGEDGIYRYRYNCDCVTNLNILNSSIWQMFYRDGLYFTTYPEGKAYLYRHEVISELPEFKTSHVKLIAVKKDNDYVFSNDSGLYTYYRAKNKVFLLDSPHYKLTGFSTDKNGNLFFSTSNAIYYIDEATDKIESLIKLDDIFGFVFEGNSNLIYSNASSIIMVKPAGKKGTL